MKAQAEAEARGRGETVDSLTEQIPTAFRVQLIYAMVDAAGGYSDPITATHAFLCRAYGAVRLGSPGVITPRDDLNDFIGNHATGEQLMDVIDVFVSDGLETLLRVDYQQRERARLHFRERIREHLAEHKLAWDLVGGPYRLEEV